ncbi:MAG: dihydrofolate reductase family protein [Bacteroidota bacterium]
MDNPRKVIVFIAASLDGFIALPDGDIGFLEMVEQPNEDYGYSQFIDTVDTVIMGRKTYDKIRSFGIPFPHTNKTCYVLSRTQQGPDEEVTFYNGDTKALIDELKQTPGKNIYIEGGAEVIHDLRKQHLIDEYVVSWIPTLLGNGIQLFADVNFEENLTLTGCQTYPSGLVQVRYKSLRS